MAKAIMKAFIGALALAASGGGAAAEPHYQRCTRVQADLVEDLATEGCKPGLPDCYLGEIEGRGLDGTTHFRSDSAAAGPSTSPGWVSYSGPFEYTTRRGTLVTRETGVVNTTSGNLQSGAVTAMQLVVSGTGIYEGATGYLFVSGFNVGGHVVTRVTGTICRP
jgi:hypothetical protein